jgi:flagellar hook-basal body complex protein FliE
MNALTAIRQLWSSQASQAMNQVNQAAGGATQGPIPIDDLKELSSTSGISQVSTTNKAGQASFGTLLGNMVEEVNSKQINAAQTMRALQAGEDVPIHQAVIATEEASLSFQLMVEVRNKLLESYNEIMRMSV